MTITVDHDGHVAIITIDRPQAANSIDLPTALALSEAFDGLASDPATHVVVLTGAGERVFCAGMDLAAVRDGQADAINGVPGGFAGIARRVFPKPVIAAVNGAALGGGFEIVLACDLIVAAEHARFGLPEVGIGLFAASGGAVRLASRVPVALAMEYLLVGEPISAARAAELGLVNRLVPQAELRECAMELAHRIARNAPLAVSATKQVATTALTAGEAAAWELNSLLATRVAGSSDAREGAAAAKERRPAVWTGR
jgi:enoyl-CoA hydratase